MAPAYRPESPVNEEIGSELKKVEIATTTKRAQIACTPRPLKTNRSRLIRINTAKSAAAKMSVRNSTDEFLSNACGKTEIGI